MPRNNATGLQQTRSKKAFKSEVSRCSMAVRRGREMSHLLFLVLLCLPLNVHSLRTLSPCEWDKTTLRSDQLTVLINGYSESRIPLLQSIAAAYASLSFVSSILILWGNPATPPQTLSRLAQNLSLSSVDAASVSVIHQPTSSLNSRFLPRPSLIKTIAVLICDDDIEVDHKTVEFAFKVWGSNPDRLIGLFVRSHDMDFSWSKGWIYTVHPDKYSMVLTKFMMLKSVYLGKYSCGGGAQMRAMRGIVDEMRNCEDILMNFVVADATNAGPIMIGAERVRDWGDPRNDGGDDDNDGNGGRRLEGGGRSRVREVGLSSRRGEHRKRRGECIKEFHRVLGRMPLRYSYGKFVNSVGEQGLCQKSGHLVLCDQF